MHARAQAVARGLAQAGGARLVAQRLLDLEARLPPDHALACGGWALWQAWRRAVERAESPAELVPQVCVSGVQEFVWGWGRTLHALVRQLGRPVAGLAVGLLSA